MSLPILNDLPDPILDELHATRRELLRTHGSVAGLAAFLRGEEANSTREIVGAGESNIPEWQIEKLERRVAAHEASPELGVKWEDVLAKARQRRAE